MTQINDTIITEKRPVGRPRKLDKVIKEKRPVGRPRIYEKVIKEKRTPIRIRDRKEYQKKYYQEKTKKNKQSEIKPELEIIEKKPELDFVIKEVKNDGDYIIITIEKK